MPEKLRCAHPPNRTNNSSSPEGAGPMTSVGCPHHPSPAKGASRSCSRTRPCRSRLSPPSARPPLILHPRRVDLSHQLKTPPGGALAGFSGPLGWPSASSPGAAGGPRRPHHRDHTRAPEGSLALPRAGDSPARTIARDHRIHVGQGAVRGGAALDAAGLSVVGRALDSSCIAGGRTGMP